MCWLHIYFFVHEQLGSAIRGIKLHNETVKMMDLSWQAFSISMKLRAKYFLFLACFSREPNDSRQQMALKCKWKTFQATKNKILKIAVFKSVRNANFIELIITQRHVFRIKFIGHNRKCSRSLSLSFSLKNFILKRSAILYKHRCCC